MSAKPAEKINESILTSGSSLTFDWRMEEAFPNVDPGIKPFGDLVLVQVRRPKKFNSWGLELPAEARATEYYNTQVAKVIALGNLCFRTVRNVEVCRWEDPDGKLYTETAEKMFQWPEGDWFKVGDFVRMPKYGGDRFSVKATIKEFKKLIGQQTEEEFEVTDDIVFSLLKTRDIQGILTGSAYSVQTFND